MKNNEINIRIATVNDAEELLNIYTPYVEQTAITFEYDVPSIEEFTERIKTVLEKYPQKTQCYLFKCIFHFIYRIIFKCTRDFININVPLNSKLSISDISSGEI